jgi:hypothetical protein
MTYIEAVAFLTEQNVKKPDADWEIKEKKARRSLDSNAYFHVLCDKLRQKMTPPLSMAACKNHLITSYGQPEYDENGNMVYLKANIPADKMAEIEYLHCLPVKYESENVIFYRVYRGSHTYDTAEMSKLIAGTVDECNAMGIQTATPQEIARMAAAWESRYGKEHSDRV